MKKFLISISLCLAFVTGSFAEEPLGYELDVQVVSHRHCHALQNLYDDAFNLQFEQIIYEYTSLGPDMKTPVRLTGVISMNPAVYNKEASPRGLMLYNEFTTAKHGERTSQNEIDDIAFYMNKYLCLNNNVQMDQYKKEHCLRVYNSLLNKFGEFKDNIDLNDFDYYFQ